MTPIEETFIRTTQLLDEPGAADQRAEIKQHLDTMIEYARDDNEKRAAYDFKAMALNHLDSIIAGEAPPVVEAKRVRALQAAEKMTFAIKAADDR